MLKNLQYHFFFIISFLFWATKAYLHVQYKFMFTKNTLLFFLLKVDIHLYLQHYPKQNISWSICSHYTLEKKVSMHCINKWWRVDAIQNFKTLHTHKNKTPLHFYVTAWFWRILRYHGRKDVGIFIKGGGGGAIIFIHENPPPPPQ